MQDTERVYSYNPRARTGPSTQKAAIIEKDMATLVTSLTTPMQYKSVMQGHIHTRFHIIMRPSSLGGGRILRRTLSVCPSHYRASRRAT